MTPAFFCLLFIPLDRVHPRLQLARCKFLFEAQLETTAVAGCLTNYLMLI